jgi:hypothetical protein
MTLHTLHIIHLLVGTCAALAIIGYFFCKRPSSWLFTIVASIVISAVIGMLDGFMGGSTLLFAVFVLIWLLSPRRRETQLY